MGKMYYKEIDATYDGEWKNDIKEGLGKLQGQDTHLDGMWCGNKFSGEGS